MDSSPLSECKALAQHVVNQLLFNSKKSVRDKNISNLLVSTLHFPLHHTKDVQIFLSNKGPLKIFVEIQCGISKFDCF